MSEPAPEDTRFVTLAEQKAFQKLAPDSTTEDVHVNEALNAAIENVDSKVYVSLTGGDHVMRVRSSSRYLVLPTTHLEAVVSVTAPDGSVLATGDLDVDLEAGIVTVPRALAGTWTVTVTPPAAAEASIRQAVKIIASHLFGVHRGSPAGPRGGIDAQQIEASLAGFAIPRRAAELLAAYAVGGGFA
ncbi:MAG: hypothetical protein ACYC1Z_03410 [Georgenia sp.]